MRLLLINYVLLSLCCFNNTERYFEETHVGTNTEFYDSIGMVTNVASYTFMITCTCRSCRERFA